MAPDSPIHDVGGWLTGEQIRVARAKGLIEIDPFHDQQVNPNSYNYRLSDKLLVLNNEVIDLKEPDNFDLLEISGAGTLLHPGECYLGSTRERFGSSCFASLITGRSSIGRKFITNHVTAGLIDVGFFGNITLEITVQKPTRVYPDILFGQIFWFTSMGANTLYDGKYQNQVGPAGSRLHSENSRKE